MERKVKEVVKEKKGGEGKKKGSKGRVEMVKEG